MAAGAKAVAVGLAAAVHAGALVALLRDDRPERMQGAEVAQVAVAGAAFEQFAAAVTPVTPRRSAPLVPTQAAEPVPEAQPLAPLRPEPTAVAAARPEAIQPRAPLERDGTRTTAPARVTPQAAHPAVPSKAPTILSPQSTTTAPVARASVPVAPVSDIDAAPEIAPGDSVTATPPATAAPGRSLRPRMHARVFSAPPRRSAQEPVQTPPRASSGPAAAAPQRAAAPTPRAPQAPGSNAAAKAYPKQVYQRLARAGRVRSSADAPAVVSFTVTASGGLASLSISRSSGQARFDQAALDTVRRAAPFPKPPPGAQRSFAITLR